MSINSGGTGSGAGIIQKQLIEEVQEPGISNHIKFKNLNNIVKLKSKSQTRGNSGNISNQHQAINIVRPSTQLHNDSSNNIVPADKIKILQNA